VPVSYMGQGFERLLTLMLALLSSAGGTLIVDEVEDGLHHSVMEAVWKAIIAAAHKHDVQVFATTHSLEAIEAAVEGSKDYKGSLAFYRLERRNGDIGVIMGEDSRLRSAIAVGFELR
jgi:AAA15 family ATPase/GTPase